MSDTINQPRTNRLRRLARRFSMKRERRGTVLLIALGALGVISLAGLSYLTFVRLDRLGSGTHARIANFQQQVDATTDWIGTLIAVDLYGNKIVSPNTPRDNLQLGVSPAEERIAWPRRFEDQEFRDHPSTDIRTFAEDSIANFNGGNLWARLDYIPRASTTEGALRFEAAPRDDAWLAPIEPFWSINSPPTNYAAEETTWAQVSNLNSAYIYVDNINNPDNPTPADLTDDAYLRQDGRFVDLHAFFDPSQSIVLGGQRVANGGADLSIIEPGREPGEAYHPNQLRFVPINAVHDPNSLGDGVIEKIDERYGTDTDGDLRFDARWQELDTLGSLFGYRWVVASRVVDLSGFANVNSALSNNFGVPVANVPLESLPNGATPGDVDLYRLLRTAGFDTPGERWDPGNARYDFEFIDSDINPGTSLATDRLALGPDASTPATFSSHLDEGLGFYDIVADALGILPNSIRLHSEDPSGFGTIPARYREEHYLRAGADPTSPTGEGARRYPITEMIDLFSFWGTNSRALVTRLEERLDGPLDGSGYLPSPDDDPGRTVFGPLSSAVADADARSLPTAVDNVALPSTPMLRYGTRNQLTTISGSGNASPIAITNLDAEDPDGNKVYLNQEPFDRITLANMDRLSQERVFQAMLWSLAPLAFNEPISADLYRPGRDRRDEGTIERFDATTLVNAGVPGLDPAYHYGGGGISTNIGTTGTGEAIPFLGSFLTQVFGGVENDGLGLVPNADVDNIGASFAVLTALKMSVNTIDAFDSDFNPTVARFLVTDTGTTFADDPDWDFIEDLETAPIVLGNRTAFGEIPSALLREDVLGRFITDTDAEEAFRNDRDGITGDPGTALVRLDGDGDFSDPMAGSGLTVVGLEPQPVIAEVLSVVSYSNEVELGASKDTKPSNLIDPTDDRTGVMFVVRLFNPWPHAVSALNYEIWIENTSPSVDRSFFEDPSGPPPLKLVPSGTGNSIQPGQSLVLGFAFHDDQYTVGGTLFDEVADRLNVDRTVITGTLDPIPPGFFFDPTALVATVDERTGTRVTLMRKSGGLAISQPYPVDMLVPETDVPFPAVLDQPTKIVASLPSSAPDSSALLEFQDLESAVFSEEYDLAPAGVVLDRLNNGPEEFVRGRLLVTSSLARPIRFAQESDSVTGQPVNSGMSIGMMDFGPALVTRLVNDPDDTATSDDPLVFAWIDEIRGPDELLPVTNTPSRDGPLLDPLLDAVEQSGDDEEIATLVRLNQTHADLMPLINFPGWEVMIPNRRAFSPADVAMVSKHAHICLNNRLNRVDAWLTAGQQLAAEMRTANFSGDKIGVLDLQSSLPGFGTAGFNSAEYLTTFTTSEGTLPDEALAMPLALRIFDAFEALEPDASGDRFNGRVNINTATQRVIESLPWVAPWAEDTRREVGMPASGLRARAMIAYRDGYDPDLTGVNLSDFFIGRFALYTPDSITELSRAMTSPLAVSTTIDQNLRRPDLWARSNGDGGAGLVSVGRGFASTAELAILDNWLPADPARAFDPIPNNDPASLTTTFFLEADQAPGFVREHADDFGSNNTALTGPVFARQIQPFDEREGFLAPSDGQAERIALYRALANIVETRSDVFGAWFVLRAYDPDVIETIPAPTGGGVNADRDRMEDERFEPVYESRWFVVYDRSNVNDPTARPEILLQVELPVSTR